MWTISSRLGYWRTFQRPSSRFSFCAAKLKRADCASQGLISCSRETVFIDSPNNGQLSASEDGDWRQHANSQILDSDKRGSKQMRVVSNRKNYFLSDFFAAVSVLAFLSLPSLRSLLSLLSLPFLLSAPSDESLLDSDFAPDSEPEDGPDRFA